MVPQSQPRKPRNSSKINLLISLGFHALIGVCLTYFAAREGLLGKDLKKIAVEMVKEKPPEQEPEQAEPNQPVEPDPTPAAQEPVQAETAPQEPPPPSAAQAAAPAPDTGAPRLQAPPAVAPPAGAVPALVFGGGRAVQTSSDPVQVYRGLLEYALRSRWNRPPDVADNLFVAEVEVGVEQTGRITNPVWKKGSGHDRWDASVREAIAATPSLTRPPPTNFPARVLVRFDVQEVADEAIQ